MDFAARREEAIEQTHAALREPLSPDQVLIYAWRFAEKHPRALAHWLFAVFPEEHPDDARQLVRKYGKESWNANGRGANMDELGWEALIAACRGKIPDLSKLSEHTGKNLHALLGPDYAAEILDAAGGLHQLARMTQRDCRNLGNESGQFGGKPCKGILELHELATGERAARVLSSRVVLAARLDTYKGHFKGDALRQEVLYAQ